MPRDLEICFLPAQWRALSPQRRGESVCVVIDVIRATSTIVTALAQGAEGVQPVADAADAFALKAQNPEAILAGERGGRPLPGFDLGNAPEDFTTARVSGKRILLTTTNGTQALAACAGARAVLTTSFLNLEATAARLREWGAPWIVLCAGFEGHFGADDAMVAGALAEALGQDDPFISLYHSVQRNLTEALLGSQAGRELIKAGLQKDVPFCADLNRFPLVPTLGADGVLRAS